MKTSIILCLFAASTCFALNDVVQTVAVLVGEDAVIPCTYESKEGVTPTINWYALNRDGNRSKICQFSYVDPEVIFVDPKFSEERPGITMTDKGFLKIPSATLTDNVLLEDLICEVVFGRFVIEKKSKFLVASLPVEEAEVTIQRQVFKEGYFTVIGSCKSPPSYPAAEITFFKNGEKVEEAEADGVFNDFFYSSVLEVAEDSILTTNPKDLVKKLEPSDNLAEFVCNVKITYGDKVFEGNYVMPKFKVVQ